MSVIYIDYSKLHESAKKRILFLQAIMDLISTDRDFIKYYTLGLVDEDKVCFAELLNMEFKQFFVPLEDRVDIIERIDGEIIVGTKQLMQDLKEIQTELIDKKGILYLIEEIKKRKPN